MKMFERAIVLALAVAGIYYLTGLAFAQSVETGYDAVTTPAPWVQVGEETVRSIVPTLVNGALGLLAAAIAWTLRLPLVAKVRKDDAVLAVEAAFAEVAEEMADEIRRASSDGKIGRAEGLRLRNIAVSRAQDIAREQGVDLLRTLTIRQVNGLIEKLNNQHKASKG